MAYLGFKKLESKLSGKVSNPGAVAASIGRKKYGAAAFNKAAASGTKMGKSHLPKGVPLTPTGDIGAHRGMEAKELGTFENTPVLQPHEYWNQSEPKTKIDKFYEKFAGKEQQ